MPEQLGTAAGRIAEKVVTELARPVVRNTGISVSYAKDGNRAGLVDAAATITGGVLALSSMLIAAPIMFVVQAYMSHDGNAGGDDLKSREYRDEAGRTHHHTRTFMRDHAGEFSTLAA